MKTKISPHNDGLIFYMLVILEKYFTFFEQNENLQTNN